METDLVLSSGFLAFARQTGVLSAVEDSGIEVGGVCGTSSGALAGALWCAGHSAKTVADKLSVQTPLSMLRPGIHMWRGLFSMRAVLSQLRDWLPPTFADLDRPFAVGVMGPSGEAVLLRDGPLPEAVAASCSIPWLFQPIEVDGVMYRDGGAVDRTAITGWRAWRGDRPTVLHLVERTGGAVVEKQTIPEGLCVIRTAKSDAQFWNLGDFAVQHMEAYRCAVQVLRNQANR
jgi:predicted acylesterase/phospholipase RssA